MNSPDMKIVYWIISVLLICTFFGVIARNYNSQIDEKFVDSLLVGKKGEYKIIVQQERIEENVFVSFELFKRVGNDWMSQQKFRGQKDGISGLNAKIADFNNDGFGDLTYQCEIAARGANEIKSLFIFNEEEGLLNFIKNSPKYPNLRYNSVLDCIDAWLVYGGSSTVFLKIREDTLIEFARIVLFDKRIEVYEKDRNGEDVLLEDKVEENLDVYTRYENYKPLKILIYPYSE
jgi:hypothetical protein